MNGSTTRERRWAASAGGAFEAIGAVRFAPRNHARASREQHEQGRDPGGERCPRGQTLVRNRALRRLRGLRFGGNADLKRIDSYRLGDVLELCRAEIRNLEIEPPLDLPVGVFGQADAARLANALQPGGDIDAVAHQVAVALLDDVAQVDADTVFDPLFRRHTRVALDHAVLHFDRAAYGVHDAPELDDRAVAGALDDAPIVGGDGRID